MNKKTGYKRVERFKDFYTIMSNGRVVSEVEEYMPTDTKIYDTANYYSDKTVAENNARADELMRRLRRFAAENNECELDWKDEGQEKFYIEYDCINKCFSIDSCVYFKKFGQIYFSSTEIAKQAIKEFKNDLIWYFTEYCDHVVEAETKKCEWCGDEKKLQAMLTLGYKTCPYCCEELNNDRITKEN